MSQNCRDDIHIIMVDDCSDETYDKIIEPFKDILDIEIVRLEKNSGPGTARRVGMQVGNSPYIMFIDSYDTYLPYKTKLLRSKLDESLSSTVFTKDFDESSMLTLGDNYLFSKTVEGDDTGLSEEYESNPPFQSLKFFTVNKEKEKSEVDESDLYLVGNADDENEVFNNVAWESNG